MRPNKYDATLETTWRGPKESDAGWLWFTIAACILAVALVVWWLS